ncbi:SDR family NAD(P)-dependent oxidoreductase [Plantactinospora sp. KBS50]|uniref:SDR family NAD(P)-dependent oxidoreductase n=1 Tax=Plantactinospora sp. KBS50 TaxID=2024580 RepID=UPI000BAAE678|nr:SDR family NAD(P)-dependent oxidoreductase [Plantactinospora sp. KBS50]ASW56381.1 oxidoreductase [Plantactinospora sp. KBS50]
MASVDSERTGRTALVTGGRGALGTAVVADLVAAGWRVVVPVRPGPADTGAGADPRPATEAGTDPRWPAGAVLTVPAELTDPDQVERAVAVAAGQPDAPLRAVVNLAGGYASGGLVHETPLADFERMLTMNLRPTYLVTGAALPHLVAAGGGSVVCVAARAALAPFPGAAGYVTAKAAVLALASAVAVEYRAQGVRCNTVLPSIIDTPANRAAQPGADHSRWVPPAEIATVIRFLVADGSAPTSGAAIPVYGRA